MRTWERVLREPIAHFLIAGAILHGAATLHAHATNPRRIVVTDKVVDQLKQGYVQQFGAAPAPDQLAYLIDRHIDEEVLYRQGLALGVGSDDEVVRRRIVQKMEFLSEGDGDIADPSETQLLAYYQANVERYRQPPRLWFSHLYFSPDAGDDVARARAQTALSNLRSGAAPETVAADPFPDRQDFALASAPEIERIFGRSPFSAAILKAPGGAWIGPLRSGYGWHVARVAKRDEARLPPLPEIMETVRADWRDSEREHLKNRALNKLKRGYMIVRDDRASAPRG